MAWPWEVAWNWPWPVIFESLVSALWGQTPDDVLYSPALPPGDVNRGRHVLFTAVTDPVTLDQ